MSKYVKVKKLSFITECEDNVITIYNDRKQEA